MNFAPRRWVARVSQGGPPAPRSANPGQAPYPHAPRGVPRRGCTGGVADGGRGLRAGAGDERRTGPGPRSRRDVARGDALVAAVATAEDQAHELRSPALHWARGTAGDRPTAADQEAHGDRQSEAEQAHAELGQPPGPGERVEFHGVGRVAEAPRADLGGAGRVIEPGRRWGTVGRAGPVHCRPTGDPAGTTCTRGPTASTSPSVRVTRSSAQRLRRSWPVCC